MFCVVFFRFLSCLRDDVLGARHVSALFLLVPVTSLWCVCVIHCMIDFIADVAAEPWS